MSTDTGVRTDPVGPPPAKRTPRSVLDTTNKNNLLLLGQLRWLAVGGQVIAILYVHFVLGIMLPLPQMGGVILVLVGLNVFSLTLHRDQAEVRNSDIFFEMLVDVGALTTQLYFSGGATNPFIVLYLLQVALGAVLLEAWTSWSLVVITGGCFIGLTVLHEEIVIPDFNGGTMANLHVQGMFICFMLGAALLVMFISRISRNLRTRDQHLAEIRQQSVEEDHIVRLGLMASGAAHELGTPLATLSVILNDWQHMPALTEAADIGEEIAEMQAQVDRCKAILSGILMSSGEVRGEGTMRTTVRAFFDELAAEWRARRSPRAFVYANDYDPKVPIVSDTALKQIIFNVLDNAFEASPSWLSLVVAREGAFLVISVTDRGTGFSEAMLGAIGKPYQSTKNRPGRGLGLFLVVNVVRKLGGAVTATNNPSGGATVKIVLPLAALSPGVSDDD
jgi:two-component system sensor histidine kinase RegB